MDKTEQTNRACPKCFSALDERATVCPYCQSNLKRLGGTGAIVSVGSLLVAIAALGLAWFQTMQIVYDRERSAREDTLVASVGRLQSFASTVQERCTDHNDWQQNPCSWAIEALGMTLGKVTIQMYEVRAARIQQLVGDTFPKEICTQEEFVNIIMSWYVNQLENVQFNPYVIDDVCSGFGATGIWMEKLNE